MTEKEVVFLKKRISDFLSTQKNRSSLETIIEYLDYLNKVRYSEKELQPILEELISDELVKKEGSKYYSQDV